MWSPAVRLYLRSWSGLGLAMSLALLATACRREVSAQVAADPLGPIGCFQIVDRRGLANTTALDLCTAATSVAPGQCYVAAMDRVGALSDQQIVQLCRGATSTEPLECFLTVDASGELTNDQAISYCAPSCPLGPAPAEASDPACLEAALARTGLATQMASELCQRSYSMGPVECFIAGKDVSGLADSQLVQLCAQSRSCQYINVPPPPAP